MEGIFIGKWGALFMGEEFEEAKFYQVLYFEGGDADTFSPEQWTSDMASGLQQNLDDPHVRFHYVKPQLVYLTLTEQGAENVINYLRLREYFPDLEIEAYPTSEFPSESDYGYSITFKMLANPSNSTVADRQRKGMDRVMEFFETTNCTTYTVLEDVETGDQEIILMYEVNFAFISDDKRLELCTDVPIFLEVLEQYYKNPDLENNVLRIMTNYLSFLLTEDLLSKIDGYKESPLF